MTRTYGNRPLPRPGSAATRQVNAATTNKTDWVELAGVGATLVFCGIYMGSWYMVLTTGGSVWIAAVSCSLVAALFAPDTLAWALYRRGWVS